MTAHLSSRRISLYLIGSACLQDREHTRECLACRSEVARLESSLAAFRSAVHHWSQQAEGAGLNWSADLAAVPQESSRWRSETTDHLAHLLPPLSLDTPWYRSLVRVLLFTVLSTQRIQQKAAQFVPLFAPEVSPDQPQAVSKKRTSAGGGGGGDRSALAASKGRLPKPSLKQFTPPAAVVRNADPKLAMEPALIATPDVPLPDVNMAQYGDPLARLGVASNGPGAGAGIGTGAGGGVGPGKGGGFGPGAGGGVGGGVFQVGGRVSAPALIYKVEPE